MVHAATWAYCPLSDWTGAPSVGWPGRRLPAEWTGHIKCWGSTSPVSRVDRRRVPFTINVEAAWTRDLTSGSARWLTSRAICHATSSGPRLSGEQNTREKCINDQKITTTCNMWLWGVSTAQCKLCPIQPTTKKHVIVSELTSVVVKNRIQRCLHDDHTDWRQYLPLPARKQKKN
jgi:hypothetical protein